MEKKNPKIIAISDLHLWGPEDPLYRAFLKFIDTTLNPGDKFFIVGDLFDLFIGNKAVFTGRYHELISKLRGLGAKDVEVYYIEGNHDFQMESIFEDCPHVKIYSDTIDYVWNGKRFHFSHGDRINWKDFGYQFFRLATRNLFTQCLIELAPGSLIDKIGSTMSKASRGYHPEPDEQVIQMFRNYACEQLTHGNDFVIMGHSHFMDDMRFRIGANEGQFVNCGYPRKHKKYLELRADGSFFELKSLEDLLLPLKPKISNQI